jgi:hypothetical protein
MYVPARQYRLGKTYYAVQAFCFNVCVYAAIPFSFVCWYILPNTMSVKIVAIISLFIGEFLLFGKLKRELTVRYSNEKIAEVELKFNRTIGKVLANIIYWLIVILSIPLMMSVPFIISTGSFPRLNI